MKCPICHADNSDAVKFCGECGTQLPSIKDIEVTETMETPKEELTTGSTFAGRYQIIEELGRGGMGRVYRVLDKQLNEEIAIKLIKSDIGSDKKTIERFRNELKIARKIVQKNIGRMFDLNEEKGTYYITMEYVSGQDLKGLIRQSGQLAIGTTISIAKQICDGLIEAHKLGVVHRDLKPGNIMIDKEGTVRVMDFGIARSLEAKGITGAGVMIGTPEYMSPEQIEAKDIDQRSDIYSLGIIMYEMLTGRLPFEADTPFAIGVKHKSEIPKNPKAINPQVPEDLSGIILKCLEKDKGDRFQNTGELSSELEMIEKGIPSAERVIPKKKTLTTKEITVQFKLKRVFVPALIVIVVVIGLIIWSPWKQQDLAPIQPETLSVAVLPFDDLSQEKDQQHLCEGIARSIIMDLRKVENLHVPLHTSSFYFRDKTGDMKEIQEKLKVDTLLHGWLEKSGSLIRINVELTNIDDESLLWSNRYDNEIEDILVIQDKITLDIIEALKINLLGDEKTGITARFTNSTEAYEMYQRGQYFLGRRNEKDIRDAIVYFQEAIELDPNYTLAWSGLGKSHGLISIYSSTPVEKVRDSVIEACQKALDLDPSNVEAHSVLAMIYRLSWEWDKVERECRKAIESDPNYAESYVAYAFYWLQLARYAEAIENMKIAVKLDPVSLINNQNLGEVYYYAREYDNSIEATKTIIDMDPAFPQAHYFLGMAYMAKGMYEEAQKEFQIEKNLLKSWKPYWVEAAIGVNYAKQGRIKEAETILSALEEEVQKPNDSQYALAYLCFALGKNDEGFDFLETAYAFKYGTLAYCNVEPLFDSVRTDPRFIRLLEKIGLN